MIYVMNGFKATANIYTMVIKQVCCTWDEIGAIQKVWIDSEWLQIGWVQNEITNQLN